MMKISKAVASSEYAAIANDALKDEDNGLWLVGLPRSMQTVWLQRFYWIRWVDRLAEQDQLVHPGGRQFPAFYQAWQRLKHRGFLAAEDQVWEVLQQIHACWFQDSEISLHQTEIEAWDSYLAAIVTYHQPQLRIATLADYERMLARLAGACFRFLPFLAPHQRAIAGQFGIVDQFYNNLRDLHEDSLQGICYFPETLLAHFGITRQEILSCQCFDHPGYGQLMHFWVESYLPQLRQHHLKLAAYQDLHPAWQCLTRWFLHRYQRIEQVMQACQYNFVEFSQGYWQAVQEELRQPYTQLGMPGHQPGPPERVGFPRRLHPSSTVSSRCELVRPL